MSTLTRTMNDSATMLRRNLKHQVRYLSVTVMLIMMPIVFLLLFVFVLGGTMGAGIAGVGGGRREYLAYIAPGVLIVAIAAIAQGTAISVASDMTEGIVARFRTMAISRAAVLSGHVGGAVLQTVAGLVVVTVVAIAIGLRPSAGAVEWVAAFGVLVMIAVALTWLSVALGVVAKSIESASNLPMFLLLLPFLSSGFVPTDSLPSGAGWIAEHQPFTPFIETVRGLLMGTPIGTSGVQTVLWCVAITLAGYWWARAQYERRSVR